MYSPLIERALAACLTAHAGQSRKADTAMPYAVHPVHMMLALTRFGVDEEVLAAALLHDVAEDCPGWTAERVRLEFGPRVGSIVAQLTEDKSLSWEQRKRDGIARVPQLTPDAATVKAADQLHNLTTLRRQLEQARDPDRVWARFKGGPERTLEVARQLADALIARIDPRLGRALRQAVDALELAAGHPEPESAPR